MQTKLQRELSDIATRIDVDEVRKGFVPVCKSEFSISPQVDSLHQIPFDRLPEQYFILCQYLENSPEISSRSHTATLASSKKLNCLSTCQLAELAVDLCDEICRRSAKYETPSLLLPVRPEFSAKRNQARHRLADLNNVRFLELILGVKNEFERRTPNKDWESVTSNTSAESRGFIRPSASPITQCESSLREESQFHFDRKFGEKANTPDDSMCGGNIGGFTPNSEKAFSEPLPDYNTRSEKGELLTHNGFISDVATPKQFSSHDRTSGGFEIIEDGCGGHRKSFNYKTINEVLADLNEMIGKERGNEIDSLRKQHKAEVASFKNHIEQLENQIIPSKNQEIAKLTARLDSLEKRLLTLTKEHEKYLQLYAESERTLQEQSKLLANVQSAYLQLQNQVSQSFKMTKEGRATKSSGCLKAEASPDVEALGPAVFGTLRSAHRRMQETLALNFSRDSVAGTTDKILVVKDSCVVAQRILMAVEKMLNTFDTPTPSWLTSKVNKVLHRKMECHAAVSYCLLACRDILDGKVGNDCELKESLDRLIKVVRVLIDTAESVSSHVPVSLNQNPVDANPSGSYEFHKELTLANQCFVLQTIRQLRDYLSNNYHKVEGERTGPILPTELSQKMETVFHHLDVILRQWRNSQRDSTMGKMYLLLEDSVQRIRLLLSQGLSALVDNMTLQDLCNACDVVTAVLSKLQKDEEPDAPLTAC